MTVRRLRPDANCNCWYRVASLETKSPARQRARRASRSQLQYGTPTNPETFLSPKAFGTLIHSMSEYLERERAGNRDNAERAESPVVPLKLPESVSAGLHQIDDVEDEEELAMIHNSPDTCN